MMSDIRNLPRKDYYALMGALILLIAVYGSAFYIVYIENKPHTVTFTVFLTETQDRGETQTMVLTYGVGKYYFIGNYTDTFLDDHSYTVTYIQRGAAKHSYNDLVVINWFEN